MQEGNELLGAGHAIQARQAFQHAKGLVDWLPGEDATLRKIEEGIRQADRAEAANELTSFARRRSAFSAPIPCLLFRPGPWNCVAASSGTGAI